MSQQPPVKGKLVDQETRCEHYHKQEDIIAIKFYCCGTYYPCYQCHQECTEHDIERWPQDHFDKKAILCGVCKHELTINEYLQSSYTCPYCQSTFNEGCARHYSIYFED
ncbi:CHY zinc finger protein [Pontibacillus marinus]|uniref:CHY zinc finger protein n=1 Tax=Pontibacillus marinus TaxID=273164 RepID=UPI0009DC1474|nr:CHY zinc finger protein [Pontibacillus marinus]